MADPTLDDFLPVPKAGKAAPSLDDFLPITNPDTGVSMVPPPTPGARERTRESVMRDPAVDYTQGAPLHVRYHADRASNPVEVRKYLTNTYGAENVKQENGRWMVHGVPEPEGIPSADTKKGAPKAAPVWMPVWPDNSWMENAGVSLATGSPTAIGGAAGFALGGVPGAFGGAAMAKGADEGLKTLQGFYDKSPMELAAGIGGEGAMNALPFMRMFPNGARNKMTEATALLARKLGGATPEGQQIAAELAPYGIHPPIWSVAPDLKVLGFDAAQRRKLGGDPWEGPRGQYLTGQMDSIMQSRGFSTPEIQQVFNTLRNPSQGDIPSLAGEMVNARFVARDRALEQDGRGLLDAARVRLEGALNTFRDNYTASPGNLGVTANNHFMGVRKQFYKDIGQTYDEVHNAAGGAAIYDPTPVINAAEDLVRNQPFARQNPIIKRLLGGRVDEAGLEPGDRALLHSVFGEAAEGEGPVGGLTIKQGHNLRTALREASFTGDLSAPGQYIGGIRQVASVADNVLNNVRLPQGTKLKPLLDAADRKYAEGAKLINDEGVNQLYRDVRAGKTPNPDAVADILLDRTSMERTKRLYDALERPTATDPFALQVNVQRADARNLFREAGELGANERYTLDPDKLIDGLNARRDIWRYVYKSDAHYRELFRMAQDFRALNGKVDISELATQGAVPSMQTKSVRDFLSQALGAQRALIAEAANDPIGALKANNPALLQQGINWVFGNEARTRAVVTHLLRDSTPEGAAALHQLQREGLIRMFKNSMQEKQPGHYMLSGSALEGNMQSMTSEQQNMVLGPQRDDILTLIRHAKALFPEMDKAFGAGGSMAAGNTLSTMQHSPKKGVKMFLESKFLGWIADNPSVVGLLAGTIRTLPPAQRQDWLRYIIQGSTSQMGNAAMGSQNATATDRPDLSVRLRQMRAEQDQANQPVRDTASQPVPRYQGVGGGQ